MRPCLDFHPDYISQRIFDFRDFFDSSRFAEDWHQVGGLILWGVTSPSSFLDLMMSFRHFGQKFFQKNFHSHDTFSRRFRPFRVVWYPFLETFFWKVSLQNFWKFLSESKVTIAHVNAFFSLKLNAIIMFVIHIYYVPETYFTHSQRYGWISYYFMVSMRLKMPKIIAHF